LFDIRSINCDIHTLDSAVLYDIYLMWWSSEFSNLRHMFGYWDQQLISFTFFLCYI